jgi:hypothetical protein
VGIAVQSGPEQAEPTGVSDHRETLPDNVVSFIVVARHSGMSYRRIASLMNRIGLVSARGGCWHASTVARVARRHGPLAMVPVRRTPAPAAPASAVG